MENATSAPGASLIPDGIGAFTAAHLTIIAILAVLTVLAIIYGAKLRRDRRAAARELEERQEEMAAQAPVAAPPPQPHPTPAPPPPSASLPPAAEAMPDSDPLASEPIPAAAPLVDNPAIEAASTDAVSSASPADGPVTQLKGLGPKVAARLAELGITTVGQIAALDDDAAARLDAELGAFRGRMARDRWIEQARFLAAGDTSGFEAVFGKL